METLSYHFNQKASYPFTYGDENAYEVRLSDYVVRAAKNKRVQKHLISVAFTLLTTLGMYSVPASAIPVEYGEAVNEMLNQVDAAAYVYVGAAMPPIDAIKGQVLVLQPNSQCFTSAMLIKQ